MTGRRTLAVVMVQMVGAELRAALNTPAGLGA